MQIIHLDYPIIPTEPMPAVAAIGYFDGLHLGHQGVINKAITQAAARGVASALITFDPHPREVLQKDEITSYITPLNDKLSVLEQLGFDIVYVIHFTERFSRISPQQFIDEVLVPLRIVEVVVGFDFRFGKNGSGTPATLEQCSNDQFIVHVVEPIAEGEQKVSSSRIRTKLLEGDIVAVNAFLGRPFKLCGKVQHGSKRGRTIGFPTANIALSERYFLPRNGVYGVRVDVNSKQYYGVMNIGNKPTFETNSNAPSIEVHLLDFNGDLYEKHVCIDVLFFIRDEQKFAGIEPLKEQIFKDIVFAKENFLCYTV